MYVLVHTFTRTHKEVCMDPLLKVVPNGHFLLLFSLINISVMFLILVQTLGESRVWLQQQNFKRSKWVYRWATWKNADTGGWRRRVIVTRGWGWVWKTPSSPTWQPPHPDTYTFISLLSLDFWLVPRLFSSEFLKPILPCFLEISSL